MAGLVEHCNYEALQDEMIRDRLVAGVRDASLSLKLQMEQIAIAGMFQSQAPKTRERST